MYCRTAPDHGSWSASTDHILQRLVFFAVNTGIWTATFALLTVILLHLFPLNLLYAVFGIPLCSVYCNTLLANLNARAYIRGEATTPNVGVDPFTSPALQVSSTKTDKQCGEAKIRPSGHQVGFRGPSWFSFQGLTK
ncbi:hypothetical protein J3R83DRAFT_8610 [Lanmaoa asiatica]|nr:hypothetical protein J3R83DRAFT_8610 [Lanmaoa asiatica]